MGLRRRHAPRTSRVGVRAGVVIALAVLATGCQAGDPTDDETQEAESAALRVETVSGADRLDDQTRTELEGEVGDVLSDYVVEAFLGTFPREDFVQSFGAFTSRAARDAAGSIEVLTATNARDATAIRATQLDARLSFLTQRRAAYAGSARVHFAFDATMDDGATRPLVLDGRIMLVPGDDSWQVFGFDLTLDDGAPVDAETESEDPS
ncbi:hypothetical protein J2X46_004379 [Nocardioides sp. BE266]|uniref:hypothetical protein n=1 Tax=Nocardioides sp. BE266 TaxID=2817725 RepID=UPI0028610E6B|nr:hypothetical protein [Nocardioides sp. BE266]MDR7255377.1 hypothetical protein [Nocardioides sp. BE266]